MDIAEPADAPPVATTRSRRPQSLYTELAATIRESGLLRRRRGWYWTQIVLCSAALAAIAAGVVVLDDSWWQLALAAVLGLVTTQFGFLGHDAAHRQVFASATGNDWAARLLAGLGAGLSFGWWRSKHNRHHAAPNQVDRDPDIAPGTFAFTPEIAASRTGPAAAFTRRQGWLFVPLLTLEGLNLHAASIITLLRRDDVPYRRLELAMVVLRLGGYVALLLVVLPPGMAAAFFGVQMAVFGVGLGASFAPNHKGMPIVPAGATVDFLRRQVLMSRNVHGGALTDVMMGGLNYQIEHHLFPSMPRPNLRRARPLIREYCERHQVDYAEVGLVESWGIVVRYMNTVGLRDPQPFSCPVSTTLR
ncbi:fatty acid desaturase family protein [Solicola sp. PLA-1-18]|uniref:fatty acid desaturase family protein n=1 Tax=Solicola sp. PLA-1-18 TaxID=3380532 RepID=UPI003B7F883B